MYMPSDWLQLGRKRSKAGRHVWHPCKRDRVVKCHRLRGYIYRKSKSAEKSKFKHLYGVKVCFMFHVAASIELFTFCKSEQGPLSLYWHYISSLRVSSSLTYLRSQGFERASTRLLLEIQISFDNFSRNTIKLWYKYKSAIIVPTAWNVPRPDCFLTSTRGLNSP